MKLLRCSTFSPTIFTEGSILSIGNFDGVHLGHKALIHRIKLKAELNHLPMVVVLFEPQPGEYFNGLKAPARLTSLREKLYYLSQLGVDYVCCLPFNAKLAEMPAQDFVEKILFNRFNAKYCIIGEDFRFGQNRAGDVSLLQKFAIPRHVEIETFPDFQVDNQRVSSTRIRHALSEGALTNAEALLGRPYSLLGRVVRGEGRGRQWGIPTANVHMSRKKLPLAGVFAVELRVLPDGIIWKGVANLGQRPTLNGTKTVLEVHIFDFNKNIYGQSVEVYFKRKLRSEVKFDSEKALIAQIRLDMAEARQLS